MVSRSPTHVAKLFARLQKSPQYIFPRERQKVQAPDKQGVYLITSPRGRVVHVGRTLRGKRGIAQRLKDHLHANSSFTIQYLKRQGKRLRGKFAYRYLEIKDEATRAYVEAYAIGRLCPAHIGLGLEVKRRSRKRK